MEKYLAFVTIDVWTLIFTWANLLILFLLMKKFFFKPINGDDVYVIIKVRNREKDLEYIVRSVVWRNLKQSGGGFVPNVLIVDMGSDDSTAAIARALADDYSFIYYITQEEYASFIDHF